MTKTYSTRSNAKRAAEKTGLAAYRIDEVDGGFAVVADEVVAETVSYAINEGTNSAGEPAADDFAPPAFLAKDAVANPTEPRVEEPAKAERRKAAIELAPQPATPEQDRAVADAFAAYLAADERTDEFMRSLFTHCFLAGKDAAASRKPRASRAERAPRRDGPTKREIAAGLLTRPEGTTTREILDATGWPAVSVPGIAKASGLTLRQEKDGRVTRYFAEAA